MITGDAATLLLPALLTLLLYAVALFVVVATRRPPPGPRDRASRPPDRDTPRRRPALRVIAGGLPRTRSA